MTTTAEPREHAQSGDTVERSVSTLRRYRTSAVIVIALAAAFIVWLVARDNGGSSKSSPTAVSAAQLSQLAASVGHPIFWLGPRVGMTNELVQAKDGSIYVRYLPAGVAVGAAGEYLTVATYPFPNAYPAIEAVSRQNGVVGIRLRNGSLAETSRPAAASTNVHVAYPGVDYQAEVFDPAPGKATEYVRHGQLAAFGKLNLKPLPKISAATPAKLNALAASLGHPIYWIGPKKGYTYELARSSNGQILIRYLPPGQKIHATGSYLTIGTYPLPKALAAVQRLAEDPDAETISLPRGGLAVINSGTPQSIHLAYPKSRYQVEVYDPSAAEAKRIVSTGKLKRIG